MHSFLTKSAVWRIAPGRSAALAVAAALGVFGAGELARGALVVDSVQAPVTVTFDSELPGVNTGTYAGGGFGDETGQLHTSGWAAQLNSSDPSSQKDFGNEPISSNYLGVSEQGVHDSGPMPAGLGAAEGTAISGRALAVQPGSFTQDSQTRDVFKPGWIVLRVHNQTQLDVIEWSIAYDPYFQDNPFAATEVKVSIATVDSLSDSVSDAIVWAELPTLGFTATGSGGQTTWQPVDQQNNQKSMTLPFIVPSEHFLYVRWEFNATEGNGDGIAIDNIQITAVNGIAPVPEPGTLMLFGTGMLGAGFMGWRRRRAKQSSATPEAGTVQS